MQCSVGNWQVVCGWVGWVHALHSKIQRDLKPNYKDIAIRRVHIMTHLWRKNEQKNIFAFLPFSLI